MEGHGGVGGKWSVVIYLIALFIYLFTWPSWYKTGFKEEPVYM